MIFKLALGIQKWEGIKFDIGLLECWSLYIIMEVLLGSLNKSALKSKIKRIHE